MTSTQKVLNTLIIYLSGNAIWVLTNFSLFIHHTDRPTFLRLSPSDTHTETLSKAQYGAVFSHVVSLILPVS